MQQQAAKCSQVNVQMFIGFSFLVSFMFHLCFYPLPGTHFLKEFILFLLIDQRLMTILCSISLCYWKKAHNTYILLHSDTTPSCLLLVCCQMWEWWSSYLFQGESLWLKLVIWLEPLWELVRTHREQKIS